MPHPGKPASCRHHTRLAAPLAPLALLALLTGCVAGTAPQRLPVANGAVVAAVPAGYCLDAAASHDAADQAVLVAGRCQAGSGGQDPAVIAISVGTEGSASALQAGARAMADWFASPAGLAALARDGRAGSVHLAEVLVADGALLLRVVDRSVGPYWRGVFSLRGRLVSVSVAPPAGGTLPPESGRKLLDRAIAALRQANPAKSP